MDNKRSDCSYLISEIKVNTTRMGINYLKKESLLYEFSLFNKLSIQALPKSDIHQELF
jgi:hypothetical protein